MVPPETVRGQEAAEPETVVVTPEEIVYSGV